MKNFLKVLILPIAIITMVGGFAHPAFAVEPTPLSVTFSSNPLFSEANFTPGGEVTSNVGVENNSGSSQNIIVEATNAVDTSGLGDKLNLIIKEGGTPLYTGTLGAFLRAGEVSLSSLANENNTSYSFNVSFDGSAENNLQGKNLGFDLCIGFEGGATQCGNTVISGENGGGGGGGGGSSTSGSGGNTITLVIYNEQAINILNVGNSGVATITWDTNKLSTSQVIYGVSPGLYNLDLNILPNLGYPYGSVEDPLKVTNHSVLLTGLTPGATYVYRVVSHASPATVGYEHQFTVPLLAQAGNPNPGLVLGASTGGGGVGPASGSGSSDGGTGGSGGSVLGDTTLNTGDTTGSDGNLAAAFASGFGGLLSACNLIALLILLVIYLIWRFWLRRKYKKAGIPEEEIKNRSYLYFGLASLIVILILVVLGKYCPLPILIISFIISTCAYIYRRFK
jgi:hypothetical protein